jgi:hypothetical protein
MQAAVMNRRQSVQAVLDQYAHADRIFADAAWWLRTPPFLPALLALGFASCEGSIITFGSRHKNSCAKRWAIPQRIAHWVRRFHYIYLQHGFLRAFPPTIDAPLPKRTTTTGGKRCITHDAMLPGAV